MVHCVHTPVCTYNSSCLSNFIRNSVFRLCLLLKYIHKQAATTTVRATATAQIATVTATVTAAE